MRVNEKLLEEKKMEEVLSYLKSRGIEITKTDYGKGTARPDLVGFIVDESGELVKTAAIELKAKAEVDVNTQKLLIRSAKKLNCQYALLSVYDESELQKIWFDTETFLPVTEPRFESHSNYIQSKKDIRQYIYRSLDALKGNVMNHDHLRIITILLFVRKYLEDSSTLNDADLSKENVISLLEKAKNHYGIEMLQGIEKLDEKTINRVLEVMENLPPTSEHYYEAIISIVENSRSREMGMYATPQKLVDTVTGIVNTINPSGVALDLACGLGLLMKKILNNSDIKRFVGIELNKEIFSLAKVLTIISGTKDVEILNLDALNLEEKEQYDLICFEPPMGPQVIGSEYPGYFVNGGGKRRRVDYSEVFIEKAINLLKIKGFIVAIVPEGILFTSQSELVRKLILDKTVVRAVISLPETINNPFSGIKLSVLILQKKDKDNMSSKEFFAGKIESLDEDKEEVISALKNWIQKEV